MGWGGGLSVMMKALKTELVVFFFGGGGGGCH